MTRWWHTVYGMFHNLYYTTFFMSTKDRNTENIKPSSFSVINLLVYFFSLWLYNYSKYFFPTYYGTHVDCL